MSIKTKSFLLRFLKGFVSSGVASVLVFLQPLSGSLVIPTWQQFLFSLIIAFLTGAFMSIEKMLTWTDTPPTNETI